MKQKGEIGLAAVLIGAVILGAAGFGFANYRSMQERFQEQSRLLEEQEARFEVLENKATELEQLGAFRPSNYVGKLLTRLNEGGSESTFNTTPGAAADGSSLTTAKLGDFMVFTINPGAANEEKISVSAVSVSGTTATWTIINRGLSFTENVSVTANKKQHAIGETVIISNDDHYLSSQYVNTDDTQSITGRKTFTASSTFSVSPTLSEDCETSSANTDICAKAYIDGVAVAGASNANTTTKGIVEIATDAENAAGTGTGGTGAILVIPSSSANSTATANKIPVANGSGKLAQGWLDLTENFNISGLLTSSGATTTISSATTTISSSVGVLGIGTTTPSTKQGGISVSKNAYFAQGVGVGHATTTSSPNLQVNGNLIVTQNASTTRLNVGQCSGCISGYETVTQAGALNGGSPATGTATASCSAGKVVVGGGVDGPDTNNSYGINSSYPPSNNSWTANLSGANGTTDAFTVYAICVTQ